MEILVGISPGKEEKQVRSFLKKFKIVMINEQISETAIVIRRSKKIKLPDAIIWATAIVQNSILITRNTKDFSSSEPSITIPY